jgi:signal transduction histidine kinase
MLLFNANEKGIELKAEIDGRHNLNLIEAIHGDENRFLQILLNFLSNSLKFTDPKGSITVKVEITNQQPILNDIKLKRES